MRRFRFFVVLTMIIGLLVAFKLLLFPGGVSKAPSKSSGPSNPASAEVVVSGLRVKSEKLDQIISSTGSLKANEEVNIQPEVSGKIIALYFKEGSKVRKGQVLFRLNDLDLRATLKKLQLNVQLAVQNESRQSKLLAINGISQQDYDVANNTVQATRADIEFTKAALAKTVVMAPFNGQIGLRYVSIGTFVSPATKIATIQQIDPLKLDFSIPEQYASQVKIGDPLDFTVEGARTPHRGVIEAIEPRIDISTRTLSVRALYRNSSETMLLPGAFANIKLVLHTNSQAILVPTESLVPVLKGQTVFIYHQGTVHQTPVQTGTRTDTKIEITEGLSPGDTVITSGLLSLKSNQQVRLQHVQ